MRVITWLDASVDLSGIDNHTLRNLRMVVAAGVARSNKGNVLLVAHHMAYMPDGRTILSPGQLEHRGCKIEDRSKKVTGKHPYLETPTGFIVPIAIRKGLPYIQLRFPSDKEIDELPRVEITSPQQWDPRILDNDVDETWYDNNSPEDGPPSTGPVNDKGELQEDPFQLDSDPSDHEDRRHQSIDRGKVISVNRVSIEASLARLIEDELIDDHGVIEVNVNTRSRKGVDAATEASAPTRKKKKGRRRGTVKPPSVLPVSEDDPPPKEPRLPQRLRPVPEAQEVSDDEETDIGYNNRAKDAEAHLAANSGEPRILKPSKRSYEKYGRHFPGVSLHSIKKTLEATTQYGTRGAVEGATLRNRIKSPNPILGIPRRHEPVATDTLYSSSPAVYDGSTACQFFIGRKSMYRTVYPLGTSDKQFPRVLMDEIRKYGCMDVLVSDNAKAEIGHKVKEILRQYCIDDYQSEPYKGNQNFAERGWMDTKTKVKLVLNFSNAPGECWLLCLEYVCVIQNHVAIKSLGWRTPTEWLLGYTPDISPLLQFEFYEPVYYQKYDGKFPGSSDEEVGRFVGISLNVGNAMTFKILTKDKQVIHRSVVRSAVKRGVFRNRRADEDAPEMAAADHTPKVGPNASGTPSEDPKGETITPETVTEEEEDTIPTHTLDEEFTSRIAEDILRSKWDEHVQKGGTLPTIDVEDLVGRTFIDNPDDDGVQLRAKIESATPIGKQVADRSEDLYRFQCKVGDKTFEEIMSYNKMLEWCDRDLQADDFYRVDGVTGHKKVGNQWYLRIRWGDNTVDWRLLGDIFNDDPVEVAMYAKENGMLDEPGWRRCKNYVKNNKKLARMIHQARLKCNRNAPRYKYGVQVPRSHDEAVRIDRKNGNTHWQDAEKLEVAQLKEYEVFRSQGPGGKLPEGYKIIPCHMVYDVKHDGRKKARFVAGGHRTDIPDDSVYSGVVSLLGIRAVTLIAELNDLELWGTDIGNAYLQSYTKEKVAFIAGDEFGDLAGCVLVIVKALYGLRSSGKCWHERFSDVLVTMGFMPSRAEPDIWMRDKGDHYEYIAVYVDDLLIASKNPQAIIDALEAVPFKLKGTGPIEFHLGCNFGREEDGTLYFGPQKYIERLAKQYLDMFGKTPRANMSSPLEKGDHPELDTSPLLDQVGIQKYQSLIGALQWTITLGRFDIATAVMTMSGFRAAPREGHLDRVRRIVGYLVKMKQGVIRVRTAEPDYSTIPEDTYDWEHTVYGKVHEQLPRDAPPPKGKRIIHTAYVDANLMHDLATGRSVTGILHFFNQTPVDWFSKKQPTAETATYGSEFIAAKTAAQQSLGLRIFLRYLGVEVHGPSHMFGDNGSVITSSSIPHSPLKKRHLALAYHFTRESIASKAVRFSFIPGDVNPADILSKHWGYQAIWPQLQAIMFWRGDTTALLVDKSLRPNARKGSDKRSISRGDGQAASDGPLTDTPTIEPSPERGIDRDNGESQKEAEDHAEGSSTTRGPTNQKP